jgi:Ca2+-binding RTX toxin-like protein
MIGVCKVGLFVFSLFASLCVFAVGTANAAPTTASVSNGLLLISGGPASKNDLIVTQSGPTIFIEDVLNAVTAGSGCHNLEPYMVECGTQSTPPITLIRVYLGDLDDKFWGASVSINMQVSGGSGKDTISTGSGSDWLFGEGENDTLSGGGGNDLLVGGAGTDTVSYDGAPSAVRVSLAATSAQDTLGAGTDTIGEVESLVGSAFNDQLYGTSGINSISGLAGNDTIEGGGGSDTLDGGPGTDDYVRFAFATSGVTVNLQLQPQQQNTGGAGPVTMKQFEGIIGSAYNDTLTGDALPNWLEGNEGSDTLKGLGSEDFLFGDLSNTGSTNDGADWLWGGPGSDWLEGGGGIDHFRGEDGNNDYLISDDGVLETDIDCGAGVSDAHSKFPDADTSVNCERIH